MSDLCNFDITLSIEATGLLGGTHEYNPYIAYHGSFIPYKTKECVSLIPLATNNEKVIGGLGQPYNSSMFTNGHGHDNHKHRHRDKRTHTKGVDTKGEVNEEPIYNYDKDIVTYTTPNPLSIGYKDYGQ